MDQIIKSCKCFWYNRISKRPKYSQNHCNVLKSVSANCSENHYNVRLSQPTASADLNLLLGFNAAPPHFINLVWPVAKWKLHTHKNGKLLPVHASTNLLTALMNHKLWLGKMSSNDSWFPPVKCFALCSFSSEINFSAKMPVCMRSMGNCHIGVQMRIV